MRHVCPSVCLSFYIYKCIQQHQNNLGYIEKHWNIVVKRNIHTVTRQVSQSGSQSFRQYQIWKPTMSWPFRRVGKCNAKCLRENLAAKRTNTGLLAVYCCSVWYTEQNLTFWGHKKINDLVLFHKIVLKYKTSLWHFIHDFYIGTISINPRIRHYNYR